MADWDLKQMQSLQLKLYDEFSRVCELYKIPYFLAYGTCLGAVRHRGFIPWDDDIDVFVFARDLPKLRNAMSEELADGFFYQCEETEPDFHMTITRLRLDGTTAIDMDNIECDVHQGVFIDIYPLYEIAANTIGVRWQQAWAMVNCLLTIHRIPRNHGSLGKLAARIGFSVFDHPGVKEFARSVMTRFSGIRTGYLANLSSGWIDIKEIFPANAFDQLYVEFEGRNVPIPRGYDRILSDHYGDYMTLPPEDKRKSNHTLVFFDANNPYEIYKGTQYLVN